MAYTEKVTSGMTVENEYIDNWGEQTVEAGGKTINTTVSYAATQQVYGEAIGTIVEWSQRIYDGGVAKDTVLTADGTQRVFAGGSSYNVIANGESWDDYLLYCEGGVIDTAIVYNGLTWGSGTWLNTTVSGDGAWGQSYGGTDIDGLKLVDGGHWELATSGDQRVKNVTIDNGAFYINDTAAGATVSAITGVNARFDISADCTVDGLSLSGDSLLVGNFGTLTNVTLSGDDTWAQCGGTQTVTGLNIFEGAKYESMGSSLTNVVVDDKNSHKKAVGDTRDGAELILFSNSNSHATNVTLRAGGSAHVYDGALIEDVTVEKGGVLYLTNWGLQGSKLVDNVLTPIVGSASNVIVKDGGALWIGGDGSEATGTIEKGGQLWGLKGSQAVDLKVWDSATNKYQTYNWSGYTDEITVYANVHFEGNGNQEVLSMSRLDVNKGGTVSNMFYLDEVSGSYVGKAYSFTGGVVENWFVTDKCSLFGDLGNKVDRNDDLQLKNVTLEAGGILDGFRTNYTNESNGTYVAADGTSTKWSFGNKKAENMVINNGYFLIEGGAVANNTTVNDGLLAIVTGATSTNTVIDGDTTLQVYGNAANITGVNNNYVATNRYHNFSLVDGVAENFVFADGGLYIGYTGNVLKNSLVIGAADVASGITYGFANYSLAQFTAGSKAENVTFVNGASLWMQADSEATDIDVADAMAYLETGSKVNGLNSNDSDIHLQGTVIDNLTSEDDWIYTEAGASTITNGTIIDGTLQFGPGSLTMSNVDMTGTAIAMGTGYYGAYFQGGAFDKVTLDGKEFGVNNVYKDFTASKFFCVEAKEGESLTFENIYIGKLDAGSAFAVKGNVNLKNITLDAGAGWSGVSLESTNAIDGFTLVSGWMGMVNNITNLVIDASTSFWDTRLYLDSADQVVDGITMHNGGILLGYQTQTTVLKNIVMDGDGATMMVRCGKMENLTMTAGVITFWADSDYHQFSGKLSLGGGGIYCGAWGSEDEKIAGKYDLDLSEVTEFKITGDMTIGMNVTNGTNKTVYISGENNGFGGVNSSYVMDISNVVFGMAGDWFLTGGAWSDLSLITTDSWSFAGRLGQGDYNIGKINYAFESIACTFGGKAITMAIGDTKKLDGYTITFVENADGNGIFTVRADESSNTALDWTTAWNKSYQYAVKYVNDIAGDGATIYLGNTMENKGGNTVNNAFGTLSTGAIVNDNVKNATVFGGSSTQKIATSWVKVTGGTKNTIYGGGDGQDMTDGTNVQVTGGTTSKIFGAGKNSVTSVGVNNAYAVNMDVVGGSHKQIYGGSDGGSVVGDITLLIDSIKLSQVFVGGGTGDVDGNITTSMYGIDDKASAWTANVFGGSSAIAKDTTVTGDIQLKINSGFYQGLILGGSRSENTVSAFVEGDITLTVKNTVQFDNVKLLASGTSAWIIGAGQAVKGGKLTVETVNVNLSASTLANVVGGAQAEDTSIATVGNVNVSVGAGSEITANIFVAGYARGGATSNVTGDVNLTVDASVGSVAIQGNIYAGGNNPGGKGVVKVDGDATVEFTGNGDNLTFTGVVSGLGKGNCEVTGMKEISFSNFAGDFGGTIESFDIITFSGDTAMTMSNGFTTAQVGFNVSDRTETGLFVAGDDSIVLEGDQRFVNLIIGNGEFNFDLMETTEDEMTGVVAKIFDADGVELGTFDLMTEALIVDGVEVSFELNNGILSVEGSRGRLA